MLRSGPKPHRPVHFTSERQGSKRSHLELLTDASKRGCHGGMMRIPFVLSGFRISVQFQEPSGSLLPPRYWCSPSLPAMAEWLFGTTFLCNQPKHRSVTMEDAWGASACQPDRLRATLMDGAGKEEAHEHNWKQIQRWMTVCHQAVSSSFHRTLWGPPSRGSPGC